MPQVGHQYLAEISQLTDKGDGKGYLFDRPLFVEGMLAGEVGQILLTQVKPNYLHGQLVTLTRESADRVADFCPNRECGGCQVRPLAYPAQLRLKQALVSDALANVGLGQAKVLNIIAMDKPFGYRNKAQYAVRATAQGSNIGFYKKHSHELIVADDCQVQDPIHVELNSRIRSWMQRYDIAAYDEQQHCGCVRNIMTRKGFNSGELMVVIVTLTTELPFVDELVQLLSDLPITTLLQNINPEQTNRILGEQNRVLFGQGWIRETLHGLAFDISPLSFFQNNPSQTDVLYSKARDYCQLTGTETVFDLYCGIGTISLFLAANAGKVIGIESVPSAIDDAKRNASLNGIENVQFHVGKAEQWMPTLHQQGIHADVVVVDPPRKGCDKAVLSTMVAMAPRRLVYVSCHPDSLARDLAYLVAQGFVLDEVQPVDMFPHSMHVEAVACLSWQGLAK